MDGREEGDLDDIEDHFRIINAYHRMHPPQQVFDDLGVHHEIEVPLPAKYKKSPCKCGIIHKWENPETFIIESTSVGRLIFKGLKKCKTCDEILVLEFVGFM
jgi:hypothetical protein